MKKLKVSFAAIALLFAIGLSAFTIPGKTTTTDAWFVISDPANPNLAASYTYVGSTDPCSSTDHLCAIKGVQQAYPNNNMPTQSSVNAASTASSNFANPVANQVSFDRP